MPGPPAHRGTTAPGEIARFASRTDGDRMDIR